MTIEIWATDETSPWAQLRQRLRDDDEVRAFLADRLTSAAAALTALTPHRPTYPSDSLWFAAEWSSTGAPVLVKMNVTPLEVFWMQAVSSRTDDVVPRVYAGGDQLADVDVRWLVLERLPHALEPEWGRARFTAALEAALRFQFAARNVETDLVYDEGFTTMEGWVARGLEQALTPDTRIVAERLPDDWEWLLSVIDREVMFGDLHFGNAGAVSPPPRIEARLYDPIPRRQPWLFDPSYFEVVCRSEGLVEEMAALRAGASLPVPGGDDLARAATLFRAWMALLWWRMFPNPADHEWRDRAAAYVTAAARLDR